jgi:hypothetical protein
MATTCTACGRVCETRYDWSHHGCERIGPQREANRHRSVLAPVIERGELMPLPTAPVRTLTLREEMAQVPLPVEPARTPA